VSELTDEKAASFESRLPRISVSVEEAAYMTGLSRGYLYILMDTGVLKFKKIGRRRLIRISDLEALVG
jgi:excisionase family DNA binding protein